MNAPEPIEEKHPLETEEARDRGYERRPPDYTHPSAKALFIMRRAIVVRGRNVIVRPARDRRSYTFSLADEKEARLLAQRLLGILGRLRHDDDAYTTAVLDLARGLDSRVRSDSEKLATGHCSKCGCRAGNRCFTPRQGSCELLLKNKNLSEEYFICSHCVRKEQYA